MEVLASKRPVPRMPAHRVTDILGGRETAREAAAVEDKTLMRRRRATVPMRAHGSEAGRGSDGQ